MKELFEIPETKSPRLLWLARHRIHTFQTQMLSDKEQPWSAWSGDFQEALDDDCYGVGATEDDAIVNWAKGMRVKLWNEEQL